MLHGELRLLAQEKCRRSRSAFGAFLLQTLVLSGIARLSHPLGLLAAVKFLILAPTGVALSFALAWLLLQSRLVARVL